MTLLTIIALFLIWWIYKVVVNRPNKLDLFDLGYVSILSLLLVLTAWLPIKYWRLEVFLAEKASVLAEVPSVSFHCNSLFDSIFDNDLNVIGHANPTTGEIVFQYEWCSNLIEYLDHPGNLTVDELVSLPLFTHEVMHIRGQLNEQKTECESIQRNHRAAKLLGVPDHLAKKNSLAYYQRIYPRHPYFNSNCAPGKALDENLPDAVWISLEGL